MSAPSEYSYVEALMGRMVMIDMYVCILVDTYHILDAISMPPIGYNTYFASQALLESS